MFLLSVKKIVRRMRMHIIPIAVVLAVIVSIASFAIFSGSDAVSTKMVVASEPTREITTQVSTEKESAFIKKVTTLPTTTQPTTQAPTTEVPTTAAPTTMAPTTQPPTTAAPTTAAPTTQPPTTQPSTTEIPDVDEEEYDPDFYESSGRTYLGYYTLTAYCPCYSCSEGWDRQTAYGYTCTSGRTVACNSIPSGTWIYIEGYGTYRVEDRGGGLGSSTIDIFFDSHWETEEFGIRSADVYLLD